MTFRKLPDIDILRKLLRYESDTGLLFWRARPFEMFSTQSAARAWNTKYADKMAGAKMKDGYVSLSILNVPYRAHRIVWAIVNGEDPTCEIDHINGKRDDNRAKNLRLVSTQENARNAKKQKNNSTGQTGVYWDKSFNKYVAIIGVNNKLKNLGRFETVGDAVAARRAAEVKYGFSERHGS